RRYRQLEIIDRAGGRGEMEDVVNFVGQEKILRHVLPDEAVIFVASQMLDICEMAGNEVVDRDHAMALCKQSNGGVRADEAGTARDDGNWLRVVAAHGACLI